MKSNRVQVLLFVLLSIAYVYGAGQMFLNTINPVNDDTVTFKNDVYSYDAALDNLDTNTFKILHQYELNVNVPDISLNSTSSIVISGSLGAAIHSTGSFTFEGNENVILDTHSAALNALNVLNINSASSIDFYSELATSIQSAGVSVTTDSLGISISSAGDVDFVTRDELYVSATALNNTNNGDVTFNAKRGTIGVAAGTKASITSTDRTKINAIDGAIFESSGSVVLSAQEAFFFGQGISSLAMGNMQLLYTQATVAAEEDIKVYGDSVRVTSVQSNVYIQAPDLYSNIELSSETGITLSAASAIGITSQGQAGDVIIESNGFTLRSFTFNSIVQSDFLLGGNNTNNIDFTALSSFTLTGYYLNVEAGDYILINATADATFTATGDISFQTNSGVFSGSNSLLLSSSFANFYLFSDIGDGTVSLRTVQSNIVADANVGDFDLIGWAVDSKFKTSQSFSSAFGSIQATSEDTTFFANNSITLSTTTATYTSRGILFNATDRLDINLNQTASFNNANGPVKFISNSTISLTSQTSTILQAASNDFNLEAISELHSSSNAITYTVNEASLRTGSTTFATNSGTAITATESFHSTVTNDFSINGDVLTVTDQYAYFKSSNIMLSGDDVATINVTSGLTGKFGYVKINATDSSYLYSDNIFTVTSGEDINLTALKSISLLSPLINITTEEDTTFSGSTLSLTTTNFNSGTIDGDSTISSKGTMSFLWNFGSAWYATHDVTMFANGTFLSSSDEGFDLVGGKISFSSSAVNHSDLSMTAGSSITFTSTGFMDAEIAESGRQLLFNSTKSLKVTATNNDVTYDANSIDFSTQALALSSSSFSGSGSSFTFNATTLGDFTGTDGRFVSGDDDFVLVNSANNLIFSEANINIEGEGDVKFEAAKDLTVSAFGSASFSAYFLVTVSADNDLTLYASGVDSSGEGAGGSVNINSYDSLNFDNSNGFDILLNSPEGSFSFGVTDDFGVTANGVDPLLECGVLFSATSKNLRNHVYSADDSLNVLADHCIDIRSFEIGSSSGGNINVESEGSIFYHSETQGVTLLSNGFGGGPGSVYAITFTALENVEIQATRASINVLGYRGVNTEAAIMEVTGARGVYVKTNGSNSDINVNANSLTNIGARGLTLAAGTDAPYFAGDFQLTATDILDVLSENNILFRSYSTVAGPYALSVTGSSLSVVSKEGSGITLSSSTDVDVDAETTITLGAEDGIIHIDADVGDFIANAQSGSVSYSTTRGPIGIEGLGSGGSVSFYSTDFSSTSYLSSRFRALGSGEITAGGTISLTSTDSSACVLVQTTRAYDDVLLDAGLSMTITSTSPRTYDDPHVLVKGNNIDIAARTTVTFAQTDLFEIGSDTTPVVRVVAGGSSLAAGIDISSNGDITIDSQSTFTTVSANNTLYNTNNQNITSQGTILFQSIGSVPSNTDLNLTIATTYSTLANYIEFIAPVAFTVNSVKTITISESNTDPGDRIEFDSITFINFTSSAGSGSTYTSDFQILNHEADGITYTSTAGDITIQNGGYTTTTMYSYPSRPFLQLETEKGRVSFTTDSLNDITLSSGDDVVIDSESDVNINSDISITYTITAATTLNSNDRTFFKSGDSIYISDTVLTLTALQNNDYLADNNQLPQDVLSGQIVWNSANQITIDDQTGSLFIYGGSSTGPANTTADVIFDSYLDYTLDATGADLSISVTNNDISNAISFNAKDTLTFTVSGDFLWTTKYTGVNLVSQDTITFESVADLSITAPTTFTANSTAHDLHLSAQIISISSSGGTATISSPDSVYFRTFGSKADQLWDVVDALSFGYTICDIIASSAVSFASRTTDITDTTADYTSTYGSIYFQANGTTHSVASTTGAITFDAYGNDLAREASIELLASALTATATDDMSFNGFLSTDFLAYPATGVARAITFGPTVSLTSFVVNTTNFGTDISLHSQGRFTVTTGAFNSQSNEGLWAAGNLLTLTTGTLGLTTSQNFSRVLFDTKDEIGTITWSQTSAAGLTQNTNRYSYYQTLDKSSFSSNLLVSATTTTALFESRRDPVANHQDGNPGIYVHSDKYGIWFDSTTAVTLFTGGDTVFDGDSALFTGGNAATSSISTTGNIQINTESDIVIRAAPFSLVSTGVTTFRTAGLGSDNDIIHNAPTVTYSSQSCSFYNYAGEGNVDFFADGDQAAGTVSMSATGAVTAQANSGLRFIVSNTQGLVSNGLTISSSTNGITFRAKDWEDSILTQSDADIVLQVVLAANGIGIFEDTYNHRLGFFGHYPDFINQVGLQDTETCVRVGYCGCDGSNPSACNFSTAVDTFNSYISEVENILMDYGLIEWHNPLV